MPSIEKRIMIRICEYGCGKKAKYQMTSGKWCCSKHYSKCSGMRRKNSDTNRGKKRNFNLYKRLMKKYHDFSQIEEFQEYKDDVAKIQVHCKYDKCKNSKKNGGWFIPTTSQINERLRCFKSGIGNSFFYCKESCKNDYFNSGYQDMISKKISKKLKGELNHMYGKKSPTRYSIEGINKKYPFFSKIERMRYNTDKPGEKEIQVHCKNHKCKNSKENGGWFTPDLRHISERIRALQFRGIDNSYFYCSQKCKETCVLYGLQHDPYKKIVLPYTQEEHDVWRSTVFEQNNNKCQYCSSKENLHCHHIKPVKTHPHLALDPDNGIVLCKKCHYEIGHKTGTECSTGNLANKQQNDCILGNSL